jgi:hypothetical protein
LYAVCTDELDDAHERLVRPLPLMVPPLSERAEEIDRVISEYASDAIVQLGVTPSSFTSHDHAWVREYAATSLPENRKGDAPAHSHPRLGYGERRSREVGDVAGFPLALDRSPPPWIPRSFSTRVSDRQSAPVIAVVRGPAGLDCGRRLRDAHTIS